MGARENVTLLLGVDIGTSGVKAALFSVNGAVIGEASLPTGFETPATGFAEASADSFWTAACAAIRQLPRLRDVTAVAVAGQAPTVVLVDDAGAVVSPALLWLDTRAVAEARELGVQAYYLGPKLLWLARHRAAELAAATWILQSHAFVAFRLTGQVATDPSTAALCLPHFDLGQRSWLENHASAKLPPIRYAADVLGTVTHAAARATGLREGVPVAVGGADFACAALGAGVIDEGSACLMLGTAGNLLVPRRTPGQDPRLINSHHVVPNRWLSLGGTMSGGAQEWLRHAVGGSVPDFETLDREAAGASTEDLLFLPYLQGERTPIWDVTARGAYVGLSLHHGRGHLWRALLEGIALSFADSQSVLRDDGVDLTEVTAVDGGGKSPLFRQILSDALGVPLRYTPNSGGTVAGAAMLAGLATGEAVIPAGWQGEALRHVPNEAATKRYRRLLPIRRAAYEALRPTFHLLPTSSG